MEEHRAIQQDIRPLRIALCNLMPLKIATEIDFIRVLSNTALQVELDLFFMDKHDSKNTSRDHLRVFYKTFDQIKAHRYDGLIITGAPVELFDFKEVDYWDDLRQVMAWSEMNVTNTLHICWGAQAGLFYHYGIPKFNLPKKVFGVFEHVITDSNIQLFRGFDDMIMTPHSRYTENRMEDIINHPELNVLAYSEEAGANIILSKNNRQIFVSGHFEYNCLTLKNEYERDKAKGLPIDIPVNYFPGNNPDSTPVVKWRAHANLLFSNWLNYYVYQETPFDWVI
jgi:homoserine O-succinyltransferase